MYEDEKREGESPEEDTINASQMDFSGFPQDKDNVEDKETDLNKVYDLLFCDPDDTNPTDLAGGSSSASGSNPLTLPVTVNRIQLLT